MKFESGSLLDTRMKKIIESNFHPVLTWLPRMPRKPGLVIEEEIWSESDTWNDEIILWLVSPDKKIREPIDYHKAMTPDKLEAVIRELLKKNGVAFKE